MCKETDVKGGLARQIGKELFMPLYAHGVPNKSYGVLPILHKAV